MDKTWYIDECNRQLTDTKFYRRLNEDMTADIQKRVTVYVNRMHKDKLINDKTKLYLIQSDVKPGRFYILPKVHKPGNPGRPIVSSNSHPTERLPHFVDYHLQPLVHKLPSFVVRLPRRSDLIIPGPGQKIFLSRQALGFLWLPKIQHADFRLASWNCMFLFTRSVCFCIYL